MGGKHEENHQTLLNKGEEMEMEIFGYKTQPFRKALCIAGHLLSCGALLLFFYWKPAWNVWANCVPCDLQEADIVLLRTTDEFHVYSWKKVIWVSLSALDPLVVLDEDSLLSKVIMRPESKVRCFQVQKIRYAWDLPGRQFRKVGVLEDGHSCVEIHSRFRSGLTSNEQDIRRAICEPNTISVEITPVWKLLIKEVPVFLKLFQLCTALEQCPDSAFWKVLSPFYIFQVFSVCLWLTENYVEYSVAVILMSLTSISLTVYDLRKQSVKLHQLVESKNNVLVKICRKQAGFQELESRHLVPGDTLILEGCKTVLPCDALLISGQCMVNEGMLTGESIPVAKSCLPQGGGDSQPWQRSCAEDPKRHLLFCGTEIIQAKGDSEGPAKAVVLQTGFNTAKGALVRSILYPKPMNFRLYSDAIRFLLCLVGLAALGMIYAICVFALKGGSPGQVLKKTLDVITIAVPPALPAALTTGIIYTQRRLKRRGIFCISPQRINLCGQLNLICFDKTGTLTEDGLDLRGIVLAEGDSFQSLQSFSSGCPLPWGPAYGAMVSCHSLLLLEGKTQGDPLDLKMFEATHWEIEDSEGKGGKWADVTVVKPGPRAQHGTRRGMAVLQQFPFSSALQRMSVVAQELGGGCHVFLKGAPEKVAELCKPETVPSSFTQELHLHTSRGFRVIGLAHKALQAGMHLVPLIREEAESDLTFLGLLILENPLKPETRPILEELSTARIRSVMVTGDNVQTAVTVAKTSGLIPPGSRVILVEAVARAGSPSASVTWSLLEECRANDSNSPEATCVTVEGGPQRGAGRGQYHFCMSGSSYEVIMQSFSHLLPKLLLNGTVFARMSPAQKAGLVQELQKLDYFVGMCGDGANDCGALKAAHVGISLSEQEASMAAPFTSKVPNIGCVPEVIRQGQAALITSFCMFKYMAVYSILQYTGVLLLYWQLNSFGNYQFLFQDLAINTLIGMTMSLNGASQKLVPYRPPAHLTSPSLLLSVVLNILFGLAVQVCGFVLVQKQPWYNPDSILSACTPGNTSHAVELLGPAGSDLGAGGARNGSTGKEAAKSFQSYENTSVWLLCTINCLMVALVFSKGRPFRQPVYKNYIFVLVLTAQLGACLFLLFANIEGLYARMDLVCTPAAWRVTLLAMLSVTFAVSFTVEEAVIENRALWGALQKGLGFQPTSCYKTLRKALEEDPTWPPLNRTDFSGPVQLRAQGSREVYSNPAFEHPEKQAGGLQA